MRPTALRRTALVLTLAALLAGGCGTTGDPSGNAQTADTTATPATPVPAPGTAATGAASTAGVAATTVAGAQVAVAAGSTGRVFQGQIVAGRSQVRKRLRYSWRRGCPVGPVELRLLQVDHWGFDRRVHRGELVVHRDQARKLLRVMKALFDAGYRIRRLQLVDAYGASDDRSMAANNTSAFNCRRVKGTSRWSEHAHGRAIDVNPVRNPYVTRGGRVSPPAGRPYANRALRATGMIHGGDKVDRAFAAIGWKWGGRWSGSRDYQHFSASGR